MDLQTRVEPDALFALLAHLGQPYRIVEHAPVYTIDQAAAAVPPIDGIPTKNVFVRDAKGSRHMLIVVPHERRVDLAALAAALPSTRLSMASPERLQRHLGVAPGAVSIFSVLNDREAAVELVVDEEVWRAERIQGHPLRNTATISVAQASLAAFLAHTGHRPIVMRVP